jgi:hypothetical protein
LISFCDKHGINIVREEALVALASKIQGYNPGPQKVSEECVVYVILRRAFTQFSKSIRDLQSE